MKMRELSGNKSTQLKNKETTKGKYCDALA